MICAPDAGKYDSQRLFQITAAAQDIVIYYFLQNFISRLVAVVFVQYNIILFSIAENRDISIWKQKVDEVLKFIVGRDVDVTDLFALVSLTPAKYDRSWLSYVRNGINGSY
jgi:hypothetical protein